MVRIFIMETYGRTIILLLVYVTGTVNGQGGGGVAIPWGQGANINMADFDPFAKLRGRQEPKPHAVIMDPHDPFRPKVASDSPFVGGSSPGIWSKEGSSSSFSISSSNEASSSTTFETQSAPKTRDSGGVAISLTGGFPGNDSVNVNNSPRFVDTAWWNQNDNASALNVSMYHNNHVLNESIYVDPYSAYNASKYPDAYNESMYASAYNESMFAGAFNESMFADAYNESVYADASSNHYLDGAFNESVYADAYNAFNMSIYPDFETAFNASMYTDSNALNMSMNISTTDLAFVNVSNAYEFENTSHGANNFDNNTNNTSDNFAHSRISINETLEPANISVDIIDNKYISNHNISISDRTNVESIDQAFIEHTAKMTNGLFIHVPKTVGNMGLENTIDAKIQTGSHDNIGNTDMTSQESGAMHAGQDTRNEIMSPFYDNVNDKLDALNRLHHVSANNTEIANGEIRAPQNINDLSPPPAIHVPASWDTGMNNASDVRLGEPVLTVDGTSNQMSDFDPFGSTLDTKYDVKATPAVKPAATSVNVPETPAVTNVAKPTTGMGVPVSFGVNLPGVPADDPFVIGSFVEVPMDKEKRPSVVSGIDGSHMIVENPPNSVDITTSKQDNMMFGRSSSEQASVVNMGAPLVRQEPIVQPRIRQEPDLPLSRQPIIETQPAVDFMSSFLSQPIDPTRRGNRQKTVDTQTDISIVPLENQPSVSEPSQTLAQDAKSRDWRSFISSFLMGGGAGFDQFGPASFGAASTGQVDIGSQGQMKAATSGSLDTQMDVTGTMDSQMSRSAISKQDRIVDVEASRPRDVSVVPFDSQMVDNVYGAKPQTADTLTDQTAGQYAAQMENQLLGSIDTYKRASQDQTGVLSQGQIQEHRVVKTDTAVPREVTIADSNPQVIDLTSSGSSAIDVMPTSGVQTSDLSVAIDVGANTQYDIAQNNQGQMENIVGLSETRPIDMPQTAEATGVSMQASPIDASSSASASPLDLGLSEKPLTSFEGASPSDLQKLKLLEVAQRLLLQERGIKDPQAGSQVQTFTPLGMTGGLDSILASLNQQNNMGEMIRSSLNQGASQSSGTASASMTDVASSRASTESQTITQQAEPTPKKNFQLGEWSSGVPVGSGGQDSVPIGNIFAGRFLQSGTELPSVGGTPVSPTAGIPIGQSMASKVLSTISSSSSGESIVSVSRGGGVAIKDKLPISFEKPCTAFRDPSSKYHFYRTVGAGRVRFRCALGTAFDEGTCECSIRVISNGDCLEVFMNFNTGRVQDMSPNQLPVGNMNVEITNRTAAYPGIAVFDGNAKLTIWRYQNYDFRDHVMLKLRFRPGVGGDRYQTIIANCDGSPEGPSIAIVFDKQLNELIMILRTNTNNDKDLRFKIDPNRWSEVTYLYDGNSFIGMVNNDRKSMPTQGLVEISDEALVLGHCPRYGNYNGAIDDVKIYTCIPKDNRFLL